MLIIYAVVLVGLLVLFLVSRNYKKETFAPLEKEKNQLKIIYPMAARVLDIFGKVLPGSKKANLDHYMKSLYVKENITTEKYLFRVKKTSVIVLIICACALFGVMTCLMKDKVVNVKTIERKPFGEGSTVYELDAIYRGKEESVAIKIGEQNLTESDILKIFDESYNEVLHEMLGENESQDKVSKQLNLITSYNGFDIYWEIDDIKAINYNGEIKTEQKEGDTQLVNLFATFSLGDVQEKFDIPIVITARTMSDQEKLLSLIMKSIEENNDIYSKDINLPRTINGERISFRTKEDNNQTLFLILGLLGTIIIFFAYDRTLEKQVKKRKEEMMLDFSEIVSKLSLLYNAGLSIYGAWERIVDDYEKSLKQKKTKERFAYKEMKLAMEKIKSGMSEGQAYEQFGKRCGLHPYIKLGNILEQNLSKGTKGMRVLLKQEVDDSFEARKRAARKKGEEASTKMLVPMVIMLVIVIVIVSVPALMSMKL